MQDLITEKVHAIAQALGEDWSAKAPRLLMHKDGYGLEILTDSRLKMKDRLIFEGCYDLDGDNLTDYTNRVDRESLPSITVSINREAEAIAQEIRTRLLPHYLQARARLIRSRAANLENRWREEQIAINLHNALGAREARREGAKVARDYPRRADRRAIEVEARAECWHRDAPEMVRVSIAGLSPQEAEELLTWTQKINPPLEAE